MNMNLFPVNAWSGAVLLGVWLSMTSACSCDDKKNSADAGDGGHANDGGALHDTTGIGFDPFDPANQCGQRTVDTTQVPGHILLVFDRSGSMNDPLGDSTRWQKAVSAINTALAAAPDDLSVGLVMFPNLGSATYEEACMVPTAPSVPLAPLSSSRTAIRDFLASIDAQAATPLMGASEFAWEYMRTYSEAGNKAIAVITDGNEYCNTDFLDRREYFEQATAMKDLGVRTFVVGLQTNNAFLSKLASLGGTARFGGCDLDCGVASGICSTESECSNGQICSPIGYAVVPGVCGCTDNSQCPSGYSCLNGQNIPEGYWVQNVENHVVPSQCVKNTTAECCHHSVAATNFEAEFATTLQSITRQLASCEFEVPSSSGPFDPSQVNVGVTFSGQPRAVLPRSEDAATSSWNYTDGTNRRLIIQGPICQQVIENSGVRVEIVIGCSTIPG